MPIVRIKFDGPCSYTYGPTRRAFDRGVDYNMSDSEARLYTSVPDLEVVWPSAPPSPPEPNASEGAALAPSSRRGRSLPSEDGDSFEVDEPTQPLRPEEAEKSQPVRKRGRPPKASK